MVKKLFALASVSALAGLVSAAGVAGCTTTTEAPAASTDSGATTDAKKDQSTKPPPVGDTEEDPAPASCMTKDSVDATQFPYKKAQKSPGACSTQELKDLSAFFKEKYDANADVLISEWSATVSENCAKCVFSDGSGDTWTPLLVKEDKLDNLNRGGCIEVVSGKQACGETYQQVTECMLEACLKECKTQDEFDACRKDSQGILTGPCKEAYDAMDKACGSSLGAYETACKGTAWVFEGPIKVQCITGGGKADAGDGG